MFFVCARLEIVYTLHKYYSEQAGPKNSEESD